MLDNNGKSLVPTYKGLEWQGLSLPSELRAWSIEKQSEPTSPLCSGKLHKQNKWKWPDNDIVVFTDLHADGHAFVSSLVASGYITKFGAQDKDFSLTKRGRKCRFIINGDCFDKGPSNLGLLRLIKQLMAQKAKVKIIAGNHDIRFAIGVRALGAHKDPLMSHLFIRMAPKGASFFKEIYETYVADLSELQRHQLGESLSDNEVRQQLYPDSAWPENFKLKAKTLIKFSKIEKEIENAKEKQQRFEDRCAELGLTLPQAYAAINMWKQLFLSKKGEFSWFYRKMKLMYEKGSFLFLHAGLDNTIAKQIKKKGVNKLNKKFHKLLNKDPFNLYYGTMGNVFRTKYREGDHIFTSKGADILKRCGFTAIVQGHINRLKGQQLVMRHGLFNFECDASLDSQTRKNEGLAGKGAATTLIKSSGVVLGISVDFPYIKSYRPGSKKSPFLQ